MKQKTWTELLGRNTRNCKVEGNCIVQLRRADWRFVLYAAETIEQAHEIFKAWKAEQTCQTSSLETKEQ